MKSFSFVLKASIAGILLALVIVFLTPWKKSAPIEPTATDNGSRLEQGTPTGPVSYADAVAAASESVVNIYTAKSVKPRNNLLTTPLFRQFFGAVPESKPRKQFGLGSGVIFSDQGYIVTNYHVIRGAEDIRVFLKDGRDLEAKPIGADPETDLAILQINTKEVNRIRLGQSKHLRIGDVVLAIGNPFGVGQTVTMGIISATGRDRVGLNTFENFIQTDAAINPGNSGGALINAKGELVGINTAIFSKDGGSQGIGFAIPVDMVKKILTQIIQEGKVIRGWLGVEANDTPAHLKKQLPVQGVLLAGIYRDGPAHKAGLHYGDIVSEINGQPIEDIHSLLNIISDNRPGTKLQIRVWRENKFEEFSATLGQRPDAGG